ncbi:LADA_0G05908g1_1 [Lachancea dasiensis]|uniref:LADA_0G05908g1_1 n=1 Tax=Lachancea dasiensis TaxID=1072105 RepID=A0A1G4JSY0_9SACH|nr:LADA_0G05908g1_1 [Lachancea dasiensis]
MLPKNGAVSNRLHQELRYILLIYHRNKNQHKAAVWWRHFNELKRSVTQVLVLIQPNTTLLNTQIVTLYNILQKLRKRQLSRMYYSFNGVVGLGQFVTLGVVLIGLLARVSALYNRIYEEHEKHFRDMGLIASQSVKLSTQIPSDQMQLLVEEELGEEVKLDDESLKIPESEVWKAVTDVEVRTKEIQGIEKGMKKKKKKAKKKSTMDDIFG